MNNVVFYFLVTLFTIYATSVGYAMIQMFRFLRWAKNKKGR